MQGSNWSCRAEVAPVLNSEALQLFNREFTPLRERVRERCMKTAAEVLEMEVISLNLMRLSVSALMQCALVGDDMGSTATE